VVINFAKRLVRFQVVYHGPDESREKVAAIELLARALPDRAGQVVRHAPEVGETTRLEVRSGKIGAWDIVFEAVALVIPKGWQGIRPLFNPDGVVHVGCDEASDASAEFGDPPRVLEHVRQEGTSPDSVLDAWREVEERLRRRFASEYGIPYAGS
jgi:hypothetical protein